MDKGLKKLLNDKTTKTLAEYWSELTEFGWPEDLLKWSESPLDYAKHGKKSMRRKIMDAIEYRIGKRVCMRRWKGRNLKECPYSFMQDWEEAYKA